jgi:hypothetical protein
MTNMEKEMDNYDSIKDEMFDVYDRPTLEEI